MNLVFDIVDGVETKIPVTLTDLGIALAIVLATVIGSRNLPGLLLYGDLGFRQYAMRQRTDYNGNKVSRGTVQPNGSKFLETQRKHPHIVANATTGRHEGLIYDLDSGYVRIDFRGRLTSCPARS